MALGNCLSAILCALANPVLGALTVAINAARIAAQAQLAVARAELAVLQITTIPARAARILANTALQLARAGMQALPTGLIAGCADLGDLNAGFERTVGAAIAEAQSVIDTVERYLSIEEELNALIAELEALDAFLGEVIDIIASCSG